MERRAGNLRRREDFAGPPDLARFFKGERLDVMPARAPDRTAVLAYVAGRFDRGRVYGEPEVNLVLSRVHADFATLRRYLVDAGLLRRDDGQYRRP